MLYGMPGEVSDGFTAPLSHPEMWVVAHNQKVIGDGSPDHINSVQVYQGRLQKLADCKEGRLSVCGRQFHTLF